MCERSCSPIPRMLRVLELYSGIGGMHWALKESGLPFEVVAAADINNVANDIYKFNFKGVKVLQTVIESLGVEDLDKLNPDLITMSPPCQPFTRVGLHKDNADVRTKSFFHVLDLLPRLSKLPSYILVENVKGFEASVTHQQLMDTLGATGYHTQEFLVTPNQFGVPNSRLRYYLLAKRNTLPFNFPTRKGVRDDLPACIESFLIHKISAPPTQSSSSVCQTVPECMQPTIADGWLNSDSADVSLTPPIPTAQNERYQTICRPVDEYLEDLSEEELQGFLVPENFLKRFWSMDIIKKSARSCCCFTKAYGHHIEGAGSLLQMADDSNVDMGVYKEMHTANSGALEAVSALRLRFFTPREVANLMCFPSQFCFPDGMTKIARYRVLGNSLNPHVVSILIRLLCWGDSAAC